MSRKEGHEKKEGRTEEKNGAEEGKKDHLKRWWGGVTTTQRSPEVEGRMPHDMNLTLTSMFSSAHTRI